MREILNISKPLLIAHPHKLLKAGLLKYRVELDKEKSIIRKYYRTKEEIYINMEVLKMITEELLGN